MKEERRRRKGGTSGFVVGKAFRDTADGRSSVCSSFVSFAGNKSITTPLRILQLDFPSTSACDN